MHKHKRLLTVSGLVRAVAKRGYYPPETTIRNLERRCVIKAQRDSANRRLFDPVEADAVIAYLKERDDIADAAAASR